MQNRKLNADDDTPTGPKIAIVPQADGYAATPPQWRSEAGPGDADDALVAFKTEIELATPPVQPARARVVLLALLAVAVVAPASWFGWQAWKARAVAAAQPAPVVPSTGTAVFNSLPDGASIMIDGVARGTTPLRVSLAAGAHTAQITSGSNSRTLPITVEAGTVVSQYIEFAAAPVPQGGRLEVGSDPPGAAVRVDGILKGVTPLVVNDVAAGQHRVTVTGEEGVVSRTVNVTRGATSTVLVSTAASTAASGGWLTVDAPVEMEIFEGAQLLGTTRSDRVMLPVGSHRIDLANATLEYAASRTVQIAAGKTSNIVISLPTGRLSVNAVPWAEVFVDGATVGTTPLGELSVPIGSHEVVFRHPQLGERRQTVIVKAQSPVRIGMDLRK